LKKIFRLQERADHKAERLLLKEPWVEKDSRLRNLPMKLSKLTLPTFDGNVLRWEEFWDAFNVTVHQQTAIADVTT